MAFTQPFDDFDTSLSVASLGRLPETDHDRIPDGVNFVFGPAYDGTVFALKSNRLYYCKSKQVEYWPPLNFIEVGSIQFPLKTGAFFNGQAYVMNVNEVFLIQGTGPNTFLPLPMRAKVGAQNLKGATSVVGHGIFHTGPDGIYLFNGSNDQKISEEALEPIFRGETVEGLPGVGSMATTWLHSYGNKLYFGYPSTAGEQPRNILVLNLDTGRLVYYLYNDGSDLQIRSIATDETNARLVIGDETGFVREIERTVNTTDDGTAISYDVKSKEWNLPTRRMFPSWVKWDVEVPSGSTCTGELFLDGASHQSHTVTGSRNTKRRLVKGGNGKRAAVRISGSGPVDIYTSEFE